MDEMSLGPQGAAGDANSQTLGRKQNDPPLKPSLLTSGDEIDSTNSDTDEDDSNDPPSLEDVRFSEEPEVLGENQGSSEPNTREVSGEAHSGAGNLDSSHEPDEEWLQVLGNDLLKKKVLVAGRNDEPKPQRGQNVTVWLKMTLEDGTEVEEDPSLTFTVGDGDVIQALDLCIQLMEPGEVALIISDAKYAYGCLGSTQPTVPSNATVHIEIQLLSVKDGPDIELLSGKERLLLANKKRERGNAYFLRNEYVFAINSYDIALNFANSSSKVEFSLEEEQELLDVKVKCLNNLAAAQLKLEHYEAALKSSNAALKHQPNNIKALFRKGKVLTLQGEYTEAIPVLKQAARLEPSNKAIQAELSQLLRKQSEQRTLEQAMYRKMLGDMAMPPISSPSRFSWNIPWKWLFGATMVAVGGVAVSVIVAART
ncbi:peptidyl-prolyl cis-trans isomerase FKBP8 [Pristis pectinata]|uniref:peptidyl-prolyl cis-trans isomerase FKBP8 n=1 Tax=Pristis pectinata TaxID=685728 RepID=UPI00223D8BE1|nr:peptidyl-prolyl cis-trans isomerase FKBP8 [Pristis pectinata]